LDGTLADSTQKVIEKVIPKAMRLVDKVWPKGYDPKFLRILGQAFSAETKDPVRTMIATGVDPTKELEDLRNTIAELTGKKVGRKKEEAKTTMVEQPPMEEKKSEARAKTVATQDLKGGLQIIAEKLPTAEHYERALSELDHEIYKNMGGVPIEHIKKIKDAALARKLAAEHIFHVWGKEGVRPVHVSEAPAEHKDIIEKHAKMVYDNAKRVAEEHTQGILTEESAFNVISAERDLADRIFELTERMLSEPSALKEMSEEHRSAFKLLTGKDPGTHLVKIDRLKDYVETVKTHIERTRPIIVRRVKM